VVDQRNNASRFRPFFDVRPFLVEPLCIVAAYIKIKTGGFSENVVVGATVLPVLLMFAAGSGHALDAAQLMPELVWEKRVLLVFAPDERDDGFQRQEAILETIGGGLIERDMVVIRAFADDRVVIDGQNHGQAAASFYRRFAVNSNEFRVILVGKDGSVKLDRDSAVTGNDLFALIDSMPMRHYEMLQND
jgi:hypothetical protein